MEVLWHATILASTVALYKRKTLCYFSLFPTPFHDRKHTMEEQQLDQANLETLLDLIVDLVLLKIISLFLSESLGWGVCLVCLALLRIFWFAMFVGLPEEPEHRIRERERAISALITHILLDLGILEEEPGH